MARSKPRQGERIQITAAEQAQQDDLEFTVRETEHVFVARTARSVEEIQAALKATKGRHTEQQKRLSYELGCAFRLKVENMDPNGNEFLRSYQSVLKTPNVQAIEFKTGINLTQFEIKQYSDGLDSEQRNQTILEERRRQLVSRNMRGRRPDPEIQQDK